MGVGILVGLLVVVVEVVVVVVVVGLAEGSLVGIDVVSRVGASLAHHQKIYCINANDLAYNSRLTLVQNTKLMSIFISGYLKLKQ